MSRADVCPTHGLAELAVPLYPRSAQVLLDMIEQFEQLPSMATLPGYVLIDVANFRNQLAAHLQRVAIGV